MRRGVFYERDGVMKQFDPNATCPKCGNADIKTAYRKSEKNALAAYFDIDREPREHLRRTCQRCSYQWNELPLEVNDDGT